LAILRGIQETEEESVSLGRGWPVRVRPLPRTAGRALLREVRRMSDEQLAEAMTEIQTAHLQIDQWGFEIPSKDEIDGHELSLSERIADLCLRLEQVKREHDQALAALDEVHKFQKAILRQR